MNLGPVFESGGIDTPIACQQWIDALPSEHESRLNAFAEFMARISESALAPDPSFEMLELLRLALIDDVNRLLSSVQGAAVPFSRGAMHRYRRATAALAQLQSSYRSVYTHMVESDCLDTRSVIPGATNAMRVVMPLARSLDTLSRQLLAAIHARVQIDEESWLLLSTMARHMRQTTFLDEVLIDRIALHRPMTARASITYPLLLLVARPETRSAPAARFVDKLARRWAGKAGFRFDVGAERDQHTQGPTVGLAQGLSVRLDTHRLLRSLEARRKAWLSPERAAGRGVMELSHEELADLLDELTVLWGPGRKSSVVLSPRTYSQAVRLRAGLPTFYGEYETQGMRVANNAADRTPTSYAYGRWEQNTIMRLAFGQGRDQADPMLALLGEAEQATRVAADADRCWVDRRAMTPSLRIGDIVLVASMASVESGPTTARLGQVESTLQIIDRPPTLDTQAAHRIALHLLAGRATPVGVRAEDAPEFEDAFVLDAGGDRRSIIVADRGLAPGLAIVLRERDADQRAHLGEQLGSGRGYVHLELRFENF